MSPELMVAPTALIGATLTYRLNHDLRLGAVRASAGATLAFCCLSFLSGYTGMPMLRAAFFGATFVGMADEARFTLRQVIVAALLYSAVFFMLLKAPTPVHEPGGMLGTTAFLSGVIVAGAERLWLRLNR